MDKFINNILYGNHNDEYLFTMDSDIIHNMSRWLRRTGLKKHLIITHSHGDGYRIEAISNTEDPAELSMFVRLLDHLTKQYGSGTCELWSNGRVIKQVDSDGDVIGGWKVSFKMYYEFAFIRNADGIHIPTKECDIYDIDDFMCGLMNKAVLVKKVENLYYVLAVCNTDAVDSDGWRKLVESEDGLEVYKTTTEVQVDA